MNVAWDSTNANNSGNPRSEKTDRGEFGQRDVRARTVEQLRPQTNGSKRMQTREPHTKWGKRPTAKSNRKVR